MQDIPKETPIPSSRSSRFLKVAKLAVGVAGSAVAEGSRQLRDGRRPSWKDMVLTPSNAKRLTRQLADMRGAAMKIGQMISMEGESLLPPELAEILGQLRSEANAMPAGQLHESMADALGSRWRDKFDSFENKPIASASIGQVHRATLDGEQLAVKVQYPGVSKSIDSDVDNMASLLSLTRILPSHIELDDLLEETKRQLREEADYRQEAEHLTFFQQALDGDDRYVVPRYFPKLSAGNVITMGFVEGDAIENMVGAPQAARDEVMHNLLDLALRELFDWRVMQTDPNFANYRVQLEDSNGSDNSEPAAKLVLLDFGATRRFSRGFSANYRKLAKAVIEENDGAVLSAAEALGYSLEGANDAYRQLILKIFYLALEPLRLDEDYDFKAANMPLRIAELAQQGQDFKEFWQAPPVDAMFLHRKIGGMFMLAERLGARVNVHSLIKQKIRHVKLD